MAFKDTKENDICASLNI